jgi:serine/threonine protein phosphatase PrpC
MQIFSEVDNQLREEKKEGGSTALVSFFLHEQDKLFIANVGDCRAVLGTSGLF